MDWVPEKPLKGGTLGFSYLFLSATIVFLSGCTLSGPWDTRGYEIDIQAVLSSRRDCLDVQRLLEVRGFGFHSETWEHDRVTTLYMKTRASPKGLTQVTVETEREADWEGPCRIRVTIADLYAYRGPQVRIEMDELADVLSRSVEDKVVKGTVTIVKRNIGGVP